MLYSEVLSYFFSWSLSHTVKSDEGCDELTSIVCYCGVEVTSQAASDTGDQNKHHVSS